MKALYLSKGSGGTLVLTDGYPTGTVLKRFWGTRKRAKFERAVGYAVVMAVEHDVPLHDQTGRLTREQCEQLELAVRAEGLPN